MEERLIRKKDRDRSRSRSRGGDDRLSEGDKVEADYRGRGKFYKGKISRDRGDDTYDIAYDDGERELRVAKRLIRKLDGGSSDSFREGDKVEADYRGRGKFYKGKISRDRGDDTYDIAYDDGEREMRVSKRLIRKLDGAAAQATRSAKATRSRLIIEAGQILSGEDQPRPRRRYVRHRLRRRRARDAGGEAPDPVQGWWWLLRVTPSAREIRSRRDTEAARSTIRARSIETGATAPTTLPTTTGSARRASRGRLIRAKESSSSSSGEKFYLGDKVDARYRVGEKYYPGKVGRAHADGTYDIDYDDGEKETRVEGRLLRRRGGGDAARGSRSPERRSSRERSRERSRSDGRPRPDGGRGRRRLGDRLVQERSARVMASRPGSREKSTTRGPSGRIGATVRTTCPTTTAPRRRGCARTTSAPGRTTTVLI